MDSKPNREGKKATNRNGKHALDTALHQREKDDDCEYNVHLVLRGAE
jgi:hypothetical protein